MQPILSANVAPRPYVSCIEVNKGHLAMQDQEIFLTSRDVIKRYNVSDKWLERREHDRAEGFPAPLRIRRRKFWRLSELLAFEDALSSSSTNAA